MVGGIYSEQDCPLCGQRMRDNGRDRVCCPKHKSQLTNQVFVKFGRKVKRRFQDYQTASRFLNGLRYEVDKGSFDPRDYASDQPLSFSNLVEKYLDYKESEVKASTHRAFKQRLRKAENYFKHKNVKLIRYADLDDFNRSLSHLASKTRHEILFALNAFWNWLIDREEIRSEEKPKFPAVQVVMARRNTIDKQTQQRILDEIERIVQDNRRIHLACLWLCTYVNVRPGELLPILESDIDRERGVVWIKDHKTARTTGDAKYIVLIDEDLETVRKLRGFPHQPFFRLSRGNGAAKPGDGFGKGLLYDVWKRACKNLGIEGIDLYGGTRHSSAQALREHMSREEVKELTGHHTSACFSRYFWADTEVLRSGYQKARR